jgi:hypothetical protein
LWPGRKGCGTVEGGEGVERRYCEGGIGACMVPNGSASAEREAVVMRSDKEERDGGGNG